MTPHPCLLCETLIPLEHLLCMECFERVVNVAERIVERKYTDWPNTLNPWHLGPRHPALRHDQMVVLGMEEPT